MFAPLPKSGRRGWGNPRRIIGVSFHPIGAIPKEGELTYVPSLQETYEAKRNEFLGELQKKEEEMRQMFVQRVKEKEAELKEAEKEVSGSLGVRQEGKGS